MSASLVGSEMCIRDRRRGQSAPSFPKALLMRQPPQARRERTRPAPTRGCLLYTSDAADDM
eukprot:4596723-Alexandrium_andersonii.AAC.1